MSLVGVDLCRGRHGASVTQQGQNSLPSALFPPSRQKSASEGLEHPLPHCTHPDKWDITARGGGKFQALRQQLCLHMPHLPAMEQPQCHLPASSRVQPGVHCHQHRKRMWDICLHLLWSPEHTAENFLQIYGTFPPPLLPLLPAAGKVFQPGLAAIPGSWCEKSAHFHPKSHGGSANDLAWTWGER